MTVRSYLIAASAAVVMGIVAMFLVYVLVFKGAADLGEFRDNCNSLNGVVSETANGIVCQINQEEVVNYE